MLLIWVLMLACLVVLVRMCRTRPKKRLVASGDCTEEAAVKSPDEDIAAQVVTAGVQDGNDVIANGADLSQSLHTEDEEALENGRRVHGTKPLSERNENRFCRRFQTVRAK